MSDDMQAVLQIFLAESEEGLAAMESGLITLERRPDDAEALYNVFRVAHTLKGNASTLGLHTLASFAHTLEDVLDRLRSGKLVLTSERTTLLLESVDVLRQLLQRAAAGLDEMKPEEESFLRRLGQMAAGGSGGLAHSVAAPVGVGGPPPAPEGSPAKLGPQRPSLRVDVQRLDQLLALVGEIAVARDRVTQLMHDPEARCKAALEAQRESDRLYLDLHELTMSLRMVPVGPTFQQLGRLVRDLALSLGKEAQLTLEGSEAEVDNSVLQLLRDPLAHMVRNAVDHGIEPPEVRIARGKPRCGRLRLRAVHERSAILIELEDDGAGLDRERVLERARSRGLLAADAEAEDAWLHEIVFAPGFSTSEAVTGVSGRGVGLDVVRRNISALRGSIAFSSVPGKGSRMAIRLPLTLAIIEGLVVRTGEDAFIVPLETVIETVAMRGAEAARGLPRGVLSLRQAALPYARLRDLFRLDGSAPSREIAVVVRTQFGQAGLVVDAVQGKSQVVIKPLPKVLECAQGVSSAAVLGDGSVALILDAARLLEKEAPDPCQGEASA